MNDVPGRVRGGDGEDGHASLPTTGNFPGINTNLSRQIHDSWDDVIYTLKTVHGPLNSIGGYIV